MRRRLDKEYLFRQECLNKIYNYKLKKYIKYKKLFFSFIALNISYVKFKYYKNIIRNCYDNDDFALMTLVVTRMGLTRI